MNRHLKHIWALALVFLSGLGVSVGLAQPQAPNSGGVKVQDEPECEKAPKAGIQESADAKKRRESCEAMALKRREAQKDRERALKQ